MLTMMFTNILLSSGWSVFGSNLDAFFEDGMAGTGVPAIGTAMLAIGLFGAGLFFVIHKINQQSSLPRPGGFLMVALVGAMLQESGRLVEIFSKAQGIIFDWFSL